MISEHFRSAQSPPPCMPAHGARPYNRSPRGRTGHRPTLEVRIVQDTELWEVWIFRRGRRPHRFGSIGVALATDAPRHGQDLIDDIVDRALQAMEQGGRLSSR